MTAELHFAPVDVDEDNRVTIMPTARKPLPEGTHPGDPVILIDGNGDRWIGEVLDSHDCYLDGGERPYIWIQLR